MRFQRLLISTLTLFGLTLGATSTAEPLKFKAWKEQQILEAQNKVLQISARLRASRHQPRIEKSTEKTDELVGSSRFEKSKELTDRDLKRAQEGLEVARELTLQEYAEVYVLELKQDAEQFSKLMDALSKEELAQLMKILMKSKPPEDSDDAKRKRRDVPSAVASSVSHS